MVKISVNAGTVTLTVMGVHKILALRSKLEIPLRSIRDVRHDPEPKKGLWKGWRVPGTHIPGVIIAGTFHRDGEKHFWDVSKRGKAIVVTLKGESFDKIIVDVDDPAQAVRSLESAMAT